MAIGGVYGNVTVALQVFTACSRTLVSSGGGICDQPQLRFVFLLHSFSPKNLFFTVFGMIQKSLQLFCPFSFNNFLPYACI